MQLGRDCFLFLVVDRGRQKKQATLNTRGCTCFCASEHQSKALQALSTHGTLPIRSAAFASARSRRYYWNTRHVPVQLHHQYYLAHSR